MAHLVCLFRGHKRAPAVFASHRSYCRRCGLDFGVDAPAKPAPELFPAAVRPIPRPDRKPRYGAVADLRAK